MPTCKILSDFLIAHHAIPVTTSFDKSLEIMDHNRSENLLDGREMLLHYGNYQAYGDVRSMPSFPV